MGVWVGSMWAGGVHHGRPLCMVTRQPRFANSRWWWPQSRHRVVEVGGAAVGPLLDVVGLGPARWGVASGETAALVAGGEGVALCSAGGTAGHAVGEDRGVVEHDGDDMSLPGQAQRLLD